MANRLWHHCESDNEVHGVVKAGDDAVSLHKGDFEEHRRRMVLSGQLLSAGVVADDLMLHRSRLIGIPVEHRPHTRTLLLVDTGPSLFKI